ncbi:MAG: phenylalanine--tRNA ligase subunit beta [Candidatus Omnitrophota bacterium]|jgi:phenylalanyl-tRNA synthetase beta chain
MKVTYNWLKDFVQIKLSAQELADKLTMAGLEVTSLEEHQGDFLFEIEVTSNRPDCLSVIGLAREAAAITNSKIKIQKSKSQLKTQKSKKESQILKIQIEDPKDCPLYTAKIIRNLRVGPSPDWLKKRLELVGCRSVNNIVDITNYVLFETGEPLHAFDLDKLGPQALMVRRARPGEKIVAIDGEPRALDREILVIADKEKPLAIAGVMGGKESEVSFASKNVLLEAAIFNPVLIRRCRQKLGLASESSYRFERGIEPERVEFASWRAAQLIQDLAQGTCVLAQASGITRSRKKSIALAGSAVQKILGAKIAPAKISNILRSLGFSVKRRAGNNFLVEVPCHRQDTRLEIDLIEEIARIFGYENIAKTLPRIVPQVMPEARREKVRFIKNILSAAGLNEVITYSLIERGALPGLSHDYSPIEIANPLSREQEILRPTLLAGLVKAVSYNLNQKQEYVNLFEIAKVFSAKSEAAPEEELTLGVVLCGTRSWLVNQGRLKEEAGLLDLKGMLETLFGSLGIKEYAFVLTGPDEAGIYLGKDKAGRLLRLKKEILDKFEIKHKDVLAAELSLDALLARAELKKKFAALPMYPGIARDISLVVKEEVPVGSILTAIREKAGPLLQEIQVTDLYRGRQIPPGYKGLTISCLYRADERTLTEAEVNPLHSAAAEVLKEQFSAQFR